MSLLAFAGLGREDVAQRAALLSSAVQSVGLSLMRSINAVGLVSLGGGTSKGGGVAPYVVVDAGRTHLTPHVLTPLSVVDDEGVIMGELVSLLGEEPEWLASILVEAVLPPLPLGLAGGEVVQVDTGTAGFAVQWQGGRGYLTAGHVARSGGGPVHFVDRSSSGSVVAATEPAPGSPAAEADVAVVDDASVVSPPWQGTPSLRPGCLDHIVAQTVRGPLKDQVRAYSDFYYSRAAGTYGQVFHTMGGLTRGGDSGSAVVTPSGNPVGTVVAGTANVMTLVQAVDYQLKRPGVFGLALF